MGHLESATGSKRNIKTERTAAQQNSKDSELPRQLSDASTRSDCTSSKYGDHKGNTTYIIKDIDAKQLLNTPTETVSNKSNMTQPSSPQTNLSNTGTSNTVCNRSMGSGVSSSRVSSVANVLLELSEMKSNEIERIRRTAERRSSSRKSRNSGRSSARISGLPVVYEHSGSIPSSVERHWDKSSGTPRHPERHENDSLAFLDTNPQHERRLAIMTNTELTDVAKHIAKEHDGECRVM